MRKIKLSIFSLGVIFTIAMFVPVSTNAHEIFYDGSTPISLKWNDITNRTANLKMNGDYLKSDYSVYYTTAKNAWDNLSPRVAITNASFSTSNVDLATASTTAWTERWGYLEAEAVYGVCDSTSTDGYALNSVVNARNSSRKSDMQL